VKGLIVGWGSRGIQNILREMHVRSNIMEIGKPWGMEGVCKIKKNLGRSMNVSKGGRHESPPQSR